MVAYPSKIVKEWRVKQLSKLSKDELIAIYKSKLSYEFSDFDASGILKDELIDFLSNVKEIEAYTKS